MVCGTQLGNYDVEMIQMTLELAWIYEIHHSPLKFVSIYRKKMKIMAITYFLATLPILATKITITRYLTDSHTGIMLNVIKCTQDRTF